MFTLHGTRAPDFAPEIEKSHAPEPELRLMPGLLLEISGPGARRHIAELIARYPFCPAAWVEEHLEPFPAEIRRVNMHYDRVLFVDGKEDSAWALTTFVNSGLFPFVVYAGPLGDEKKMARLRRQAKKSGTMVILVQEEPLPSWQAHYQYLSEGKHLELTRGGKPS
ncbi:MAG: hypothetical protein EOP11_00295 [Proteobacteria bacterium]|nr:MAG: hypothetical protein EOP11_00295 [Pseudomonadota bacterium]